MNWRFMLAGIIGFLAGILLSLATFSVGSSPAEDTASHPSPLLKERSYFSAQVAKTLKRGQWTPETEAQCITWLRRDPARCTKWLVSLPGETRDPEFTWMALGLLAQSHKSMAVELAQQLPGHSQRLNALSHICDALRNKDPSILLEELPALLDAFSLTTSDRQHFVAQAFTGLARTDPEGALVALDESRYASLYDPHWRTQLEGRILTDWIQHDPSRCKEWFNALPSGRQLDLGAQLVDGLGPVSPRLALDLAKNLPMGSQRTKAFGKAIQGLLEIDPNEALNAVRDEPDMALKRQGLSAMDFRHFVKSPNEFASVIGEMNSPAVRREVLRNAAFSQSINDFEGTWELSNQLESVEARQVFQNQVIEHASEKDPKAAIELAQSVADPVHKASLYAKIAQSLADSNTSLSSLDVTMSNSERTLFLEVSQRLEEFNRTQNGAD